MMLRSLNGQGRIANGPRHPWFHHFATTFLISAIYLYLTNARQPMKWALQSHHTLDAHFTPAISLTSEDQLYITSE
jgi:hypothetical protein